MSYLDSIMRLFTQSELREAAEKKVLTYLAALGYDQKPWQWARERGLKFLPIPALVYDKDDPAKSTLVILLDFDNLDPSMLNANFLKPVHGKGVFTSYYHSYRISRLLSV